MNDPRDVLLGFQGCATDIPPQLVPDQLYQVDHNGDRFRRGAWRPRKGILHTDIAQLSAPVVTILGFELPGDDFALVVVEGQNMHGFTNTDTQDYGATGAGFGESPFGEDFGE